MTRERLTMLPTKGVPDSDLALGMIIEALREKANGGPIEPLRPAKPQSRTSVIAERDALVVELAEAREKIARQAALP
jgi:hypothetical protein